MTVEFNVVARRKPGDKVTPKKFYPSIVATGKVDQQAGGEDGRGCVHRQPGRHGGGYGEFPEHCHERDRPRQHRAGGRLQIVLAQDRMGGRSPGRRRAKGLHHEFPAALSRWGNAEVVFIFY